jgi:hypothetical protein
MRRIAMKMKRLSATVFAVSALTVALGAAACGDRNRAYSDRDTVGTSGSDDSGKKPVTLSGCLQQSDGKDFILTQASASAGAVGTGGSSQSGAVEERQRAEALRSYRLSGDSNQLRELVGHKVRVKGMITDRGDLKEDSASRDRRGDDREEIHERDLPRVDVNSVDSIANSCGTSTRR